MVLPLIHTAVHCSFQEEPKDMKNAHLIIGELRNRCRNQSEQIMAWKKAYSLQVRLKDAEVPGDPAITGPTAPRYLLRWSHWSAKRSEVGPGASGGRRLFVVLASTMVRRLRRAKPLPLSYQHPLFAQFNVKQRVLN